MAANIQSALGDKLSAPLQAVLAKHGPEIARLAGNSGAMSAAALQNDVLVRKIAEFCHDALPWPVRMAVKKPGFVEYVMANRELLLARAAPAASPAAPAAS